MIIEMSHVLTDFCWWIFDDGEATTEILLWVRGCYELLHNSTPFRLEVTWFKSAKALAHFETSHLSWPSLKSIALTWKRQLWPVVERSLDCLLEFKPFWSMTEVVKWLEMASVTSTSLVGARSSFQMFRFTVEKRFVMCIFLCLLAKNILQCWSNQQLDKTAWLDEVGCYQCKG